MTTCFLFAHKLTEEGCLSLSLNEKGEILDSLMHRSFSEIKALQKPCTLVISSQFFSLHTLALPWIAEKKARIAIPFALEEQVTQSVSDLHFAFDRAFHKEGHYLIVVGEKSFLTEIISQFKQHGVNLSKVTLDWFSLDENEILITEYGFFVNNTQFKGVFDAELGTTFFNMITFPTAEPAFFISKSANKWAKKNNLNGTNIENDLEVWIAQRLQQRNAVNLLQGEFQSKHLATTTKRYYILAGGTVLLWISSFFGIHLAQLPSLNQHLSQVNLEIENAYRKFFPQAKQVINPKFRINQLLKNSQNKSNMNFWFLLNLLAKNIENEAIEFEKISFQNQTLYVTFSAKNFEELENFQNRLNKSNAKIKQTKASTHQEKILGALELTL